MAAGLNAFLAASYLEREALRLHRQRAFIAAFRASWQRYEAVGYRPQALAARERLVVRRLIATLSCMIADLGVDLGGGDAV